MPRARDKRVLLRVLVVFDKKLPFEFIYGILLYVPAAGAEQP
jgi:hypothetical protein